jgi:hypothetical protein
MQFTAINCIFSSLASDQLLVDHQVAVTLPQKTILMYYINFQKLII